MTTPSEEPRAVVVPFRPRARRGGECRWAEASRAAAQDGVRTVLALAAAHPSAEGMALRSALSAILWRMAQRGEFDSRRDALAQIEQHLAPLLPGAPVIRR